MPDYFKIEQAGGTEGKASEQTVEINNTTAPTPEERKALKQIERLEKQYHAAKWEYIDTMLAFGHQPTKAATNMMRQSLDATLDDLQAKEVAAKKLLDDTVQQFGEKFPQLPEIYAAHKDAWYTPPAPLNLHRIAPPREITVAERAESLPTIRLRGKQIAVGTVV